MAGILEKVKQAVKPGITTIELDHYADELISAVGEPSFKHVRDYKWATCMCVNDVVVHGIPNEYKLKETDILGIDLGILYKGFHTDMSETVLIGSNSTNLTNLTNFLSIGKEALVKAISVARAGNRVGHISQAIQETIEVGGYSPVRSLVGHGIGRELHEDPHIPCILTGTIEETPQLEWGMTIAIEVIYNQGGPELVKDSDGWTIKTVDHTLSGLFEQTVVILEEGPKILTGLP